MSNEAIYITQYDFARLEACIGDMRRSPHLDDEYVDLLESCLQAAVVMPSDEIPPDVVTMNSRVQLRGAGSRRLGSYTLSFPEAADPSQNRVSVFAPMGIALLGRRVGDEVEWSVGPRSVRAHLDAILYQPEAAGDYGV